jgi:DinB family protein
MPLMHWSVALLLALPAVSRVADAQTARTASDPDAGRDKRALLVLLRVVEKNVESAAKAMPADKYGFAPTDGEFRGVRTFGLQLKHLAATNYILAAAALGEDPPADAGDETGPDTVRTKAAILEYVQGSFARLHDAIEAIGASPISVNNSPISPLQGGTATRLALAVEAMAHAQDHYGQMVEYLRMNGVVPPASR